MRIAYLHYLLPEDTGIYHARQFVDGARVLGHRVDVYPMNLAPLETEGGERSSTTRRLRRLFKRHLGRYLHEPKELLWNMLYARRETDLLRAQRPDVMLVRDHILTASCVTVARRLGLPLVLEVNAPAEESRLYLDEYFHLPWIPEWLEGHKLRHADAVTVVSSSLKRYLMQRHKISGARIVVVPNGADVEAFSQDTEADPAISWPPGCGPVVGFVGSFKKWHGSHLLGWMIQRVGEARPHVCFLVVGDGPDIDVVRAMSAALGSRVLFTGHVPHSRVPGLVACFEIGLMPASNFYGSPLKVIEWMAAGRAVVAPRYAPVEDVIENEVHGLLFEPEDRQAQLDAVLRLIDDIELRRRLAHAAAARARSSLSWVDNARRVISACDAVRR